MVSKSPDRSKALHDSGPAWAGLPGRANKGVKKPHLSQWTAFPPTPERKARNPVPEALVRKEVLLGGPQLSHLKVLWADAQWSLSHTTLDLWFI